jgi:NAD(P)-dependent dehydrogenase (short-subunit alcohol dehydrogenase family)
MQLKGKRIIVTGGASGIGAATVRTFSREGAAVVSVDISDAAGLAVAQAAGELGPGPVIYRHLDVTQAGEVNAVFDEAVALLGGLDSLAMIAGIEVQKPAEDHTPADFSTQLAVHVTGTAFTNQAAFRHLRNTGGSIINYASHAGVSGMPGMAAYSSAKGAVVAWSRCVAKEWGRYMIRVNSVCPGALTELAKSWLAEMDTERRAEIDAWLIANIPLGGKLGTPEDAADLNVFLASDASRYITGGTIAVDGGLTMPR